MATVAGSGVKGLIRAFRLRRLLTQFPHLSLAPMDVGAGAMVTNDYAWRAWVARPKLVLLGDYA